jgi:hypothetical protein
MQLHERCSILITRRPEGTPEVAPPIKNAIDRSRPFVHMKGDHHSPFETDNAQAGPDVVPSGAAFRGQVEPPTICFDAFNKAKRDA